MGRRLARVGLLALMALATFNLLVGAPILSIWVGSRVQGGSGGVSMTAVLVVILVLAFLAWLLVRARGAVGRALARVPGSGRRPPQPPWLGAVRGERPHPRTSEPVRALDVV